MARDRQRAKQRRRRQGGPAPRGGRSSADARDIGLDDANVEDAGLGDIEEHTPSELRHSSADVDEALLAEAGAIPPDVGDGELAEGVYEDELVDDDFERAPDEAPEDVQVQDYRRSGQAEIAPTVRRARPGAQAARPRPHLLAALRATSSAACNGRTGSRSARPPPSSSASSSSPAAYLGLLDALLEAHRRRHPLAP